MSNSSWVCPYCHQTNHGILEKDHLAVNPACKRQHAKIQEIKQEFEKLTPQQQKLLVLAIPQFKLKSKKRSPTKHARK